MVRQLIDRSSHINQTVERGRHQGMPVATVLRQQR